MITDKGTMRTEAVFSEDRSQRYLLRKEWDGRKSKVAIIMTNPSTANLHSMDYTTLYILNNLLKLDFGSVDIINLVSTCTTKLSFKELGNKLEQENVRQILKSAERVDKFIIAWGKSGENSQKLGNLQRLLLEELKPHEKKLCAIADDLGRSGFHPLAPQIRFTWKLVPFHMSKSELDQQEAGAVASNEAGT